jgi:hypothetical protein
MMDLVYWSRALRDEREREAEKQRREVHARAVLRQPEAPLRRDAVRSLAFETKRRHAPTAGCCLFGASA